MSGHVNHAQRIPSMQFANQKTQTLLFENDNSRSKFERQKTITRLKRVIPECSKIVFPVSIQVGERRNQEIQKMNEADIATEVH